MIELLIGLGVPAALAKVLFSGSLVLIGGKLLDVILKRFVSAARLSDWAAAVGRLGYRAGRLATLFMMNWKPTSKLWNQTIEPYAILLLGALEDFIPELKRGLSSDNKSLKG